MKTCHACNIVSGKGKRNETVSSPSIQPGCKRTRKTTQKLLETNGMEQEQQSTKSARLARSTQHKKARVSDTQLSNTIITMLSDNSESEELSKRKQRRKG